MKTALVEADDIIFFFHNELYIYEKLYLSCLYLKIVVKAPRYREYTRRNTRRVYGYL